VASVCEWDYVVHFVCLCSAVLAGVVVSVEDVLSYPYPAGDVFAWCGLLPCREFVCIAVVACL